MVGTSSWAVRTGIAEFSRPGPRGTPSGEASGSFETVEATAHGEGLVSRAGVGLTGALSGALAETRKRCSAHDPGPVLRDVAVMLAGIGDCVSDLDAYRAVRSACSA